MTKNTEEMTNKFRPFIMTLALSALSLSASAQSMYWAKQYYEQGKYVEAAKQLRPLADGGNAEAQVMAAQMFFEGRGVQKNDAQGVKYATMAVKQGANLKQSLKAELARCYMEGSGTAKNEEKAWGLVVNTLYQEKFSKKYAAQWKTYVAKHPEVQSKKNTLFSVDEAVAASESEVLPEKKKRQKQLLNLGDDPDEENTTSSNGTDRDESYSYDVVEQMPQFPGGQNAFFRWLGENIRPTHGGYGRLVFTFVVRRDGSISDVRLVRNADNISQATCDDAIAVLERMPKWIPGKQNGKAVNVKYTIPITYKRDDSQ